MQLDPRYDDPGFLRIELGVGDPADWLLRQRRRLGAICAGLDGDQWQAPSRCSEWSVQDVLAHLGSTNRFWNASIAAARSGEPTRFLAGFDPVSTPAQIVEGVRSQSPPETLGEFMASTDAMEQAIAGCEAADWALPGESPAGHVPLLAVAMHALWDAWIHERDIAIPLGLTPAEEADEIVASLAYSSALNPALFAANGKAGAIAVTATGPDTRFVVEFGDGVVVREGAVPEGALRLSGPAVALVEGLSLRDPLPCAVSADQAWMLKGLATAFDQAV